MILVDGQVSEVVGALDRGLAYGDGVFRTMRADTGAVLHWPQHYRKLQADCNRLGIACPAEQELLVDIERVLRGDPDCVVKIIVTRGQGARGYAIARDAKPMRTVARSPLPPPRPGGDEHGVRARWCETRLARQPALAGVKHLNRLENVLARREWSDGEIAEGLMCDGDGQVVAGTMSNVFILEGGRLVTPALDQCGVAGVQRERLIAVANRLAGGCDIGTITPERLLAAEQVYLVNSVIGLWWIAALEQRIWTRCETTFRLQVALRARDD